VDKLSFTVYCTPAPQGSKNGFVVKGKNGPRAVVVENSKKTKPYRQAITQTIMQEFSANAITSPWADKHVPVWVTLNFYLSKPPSAPKRRFSPSVKPDVDKLVRATLDSLTGVIFKDDAQVVELSASKNYGTPERVEIIVRQMAKETVRPIHEVAVLSAQ
jgi:crossover junction endodeoxyribonuclease RusA